MIIPFGFGLILEVVTDGPTYPIIFAFLLWFFGTIILGFRFGTWRSLLLAGIPGSLSVLIGILIWGNYDRVLAVGEGAVEGLVLLTITWFVGIALGVIIRKFFFHASQNLL